MKKMKLKEALERMLFLAENKLAIAIEKNKKWDIKHYQNDIRIIKAQM